MGFRDPNIAPFVNTPDGARPITGTQGSVIQQDSNSDKPVFVSGATKSNRDISVSKDLSVEDFETDVLDISGATVINIDVESTDGELFEMFLDWYEDDGETIRRTQDQDDFSNLGSFSGVDGLFPVYGDNLKIRASDTSGNSPNNITGTININAGSAGLMKIQGADGDIIEEVSLSTGPIANGTVGLVNYATARSLESKELDKLVVSGGNIQTAQDTDVGSANAAQLDLGSVQTKVDIHVDTSGSANLTIEVSTDANNWRQFTQISYSGASQELEQIETSFRHVRAYLDANRNLVEMSAKGVS